MQDTSALEYSLAATVCLEPKRVLQLRQIVSVEDFSISACANDVLKELEEVEDNVL